MGGYLWSHVLSGEVTRGAGCVWGRGGYIPGAGYVQKGVSTRSHVLSGGISGTKRAGYVCGRYWVCLGSGYVHGAGYVQRGESTHSPDMGPGIPGDTVGKRAVRILLECCLVYCFNHR